MFKVSGKPKNAVKTVVDKETSFCHIIINLAILLNFFFH